MIFPPKSYQCLVCSKLFEISSESFTGEPFIDCEKCGELAERVDHVYLYSKAKAEKLKQNRLGG